MKLEREGQTIDCESVSDLNLSSAVFLFCTLFVSKQSAKCIAIERDNAVGIHKVRSLVLWNIGRFHWLFPFHIGLETSGRIPNLALTNSSRNVCFCREMYVLGVLLILSRLQGAFGGDCSLVGNSVCVKTVAGVFVLLSLKC